MDPNFWALDYERAFQALLTIVVLSFVIERALSPLLESKLFIRAVRGRTGVKELFAVLASVLACWGWDFDAVSVILRGESMRWYGMVLTGLIVAGGSKASIKLFKDVLGIMSSSERDKDTNLLQWALEDLHEERLKFDRQPENIAARVAIAARAADILRKAEATVAGSDDPARGLILKEIRKVAHAIQDEATQVAARGLQS